MAGAILERRELYIDVVVKETQTDELFLYQVDFFRDHTFRTKEYLFYKEVKEEEEAETEEQPEPLELWKEQWETFCREEVPTEVYATDAMTVVEHVFVPLKKKYPDFMEAPVMAAGREFIHDCVSMGRVISMSAFDEEQYLSAGIRKRMKERYDDYVEEVKKERNEHMFIRQTIAEDMPVLLLLITDAAYKLKKQVMLQRAVKEETMAVRFREILSLYPDADVIVDKTTPEMYRLFRNMNQFMSMENRRVIFSMESMLAALGKEPDVTEIIKTYLSYIKNQEDMRYGRFLPEKLYSVHSFYLPVQLSGEKAWEKQFDKNTVWKQAGKECFHITAEGDLKGKYIVKAGKEQFVLKLGRISIQRYLKKYAVLRLEAENYCYPGIEDRERINTLAACLFSDTEANSADSIELKIKDERQAYSLTTIPVEGNEGQLWLNGLLKLGRKKKNQGRNSLTLFSLKHQMYCVETQGGKEEIPLVQSMLLRDGVFRKLEDALAKVMKPEKGKEPYGKLKRRQKKEIRKLFEMYRYLVVSFGESYEAVQQEEQKKMWCQTEEALGTKEVLTRLQTKFNLFF